MQPAARKRWPFTKMRLNRDSANEEGMNLLRHNEPFSQPRKLWELVDFIISIRTWLKRKRKHNARASARHQKTIQIYDNELHFGFIGSFFLWEAEMFPAVSLTEISATPMWTETKCFIASAYAFCLPEPWKHFHSLIICFTWRLLLSVPLCHFSYCRFYFCFWWSLLINIC